MSNPKSTFFVFLVCLLSLSFNAQSQQPLPRPDLSRQSELTFKEILGTFDHWASDPLNLEQSGWKAYARYLEHQRSRTAADGSLPDPAIFLDEVTKISRQKMQAAGLKSGQAWSPVGPVERPQSMSSNPSHGMGRINCISFHPTDPNIYWVGVAQGGVWKTSDGGLSYTPLTDHLPILRVSDIAVNPVDPDNIYLALCDYAYIGVALDTDGRKRHTHYGLGVWKTNDGGINWEPTGLTYEQPELDATLIRRVLFHPSQPGKILAAGVSGIFISEDHGDTWTRMREEVIWDIEQDMNNGMVIYATTGRVRNAANAVEQMMKSVDFGATWTLLNTGWPTDNSMARTEIALTKEDSNYVYVVASDPAGGYYAFYRSTDAGQTWTTMHSWANDRLNILHHYDGNGTGGQGWYDLAIMVDGRNKERVFVGGINMWATADGGRSWQKCTHWVMSNGFTLHADHHQFKYNPLDDKYYACHDGGVDRTDQIIPGTDASGKWNTKWEERSNGMIITSFYRIGLSEMFPGYVIGGAQDNSTYYNRNGNWTNFIGGDGMDCMIHPDNPAIVWGSSQYGALVRSDDGGGSFRSIRPNTNENGGWTTPMAMDPDNPNRIFTGYGNVFRSENMGNSWTKISSFPNISGYGKPAIISALALCPTDPKSIYIAKRMHFPHIETTSVWVTRDGSRWTDVTEGLPNSLYFTSIAVDDSNGASAWITCGGFLAGSKVFKTTDGGATWINISRNLPNIPVNSVVHQNGTDLNVVYVGTDAGVYYTHDGLSEWVLYSTDLPNVIVSDLEIHYPSRKLFAGTFGRGIWMTDLATPASGMDDSVFASLSLDIYPNPAQEVVRLSLEGIQSDRVTVDMVSITGQVVRNWEFEVAGGMLNTELKTDVPAGVYFIRLWADREMRSSRILITSN